MKDWEWKRPASHDQQPLFEWWAEQVCVVITKRIALRSHRRGDRQTFRRIRALIQAAAKEERDSE